MNEKVYVSIVNYNNYNKTVNCLNSILNLKYDNLNIILIDNKSVDDSYSKLKLWLESKNLFRQKKHGRVNCNLPLN